MFGCVAPPVCILYLEGTIIELVTIPMGSVIGFRKYIFP